MLAPTFRVIERVVGQQPAQAAKVARRAQQLDAQRRVHHGTVHHRALRVHVAQPRRLGAATATAAARCPAARRAVQHKRAGPRAGQPRARAGAGRGRRRQQERAVRVVAGVERHQRAERREVVRRAAHVQPALPHQQPQNKPS